MKLLSQEHNKVCIHCSRRTLRMMLLLKLMLVRQRRSKNISVEVFCKLNLRNLRTALPLDLY